MQPSTVHKLLDCWVIHWCLEHLRQESKVHHWAEEAAARRVLVVADHIPVMHHELYAQSKEMLNVLSSC